MLERLHELSQTVALTAIRGFFLLGGAIASIVFTLCSIGVGKETIPLGGAIAIPGAMFSSLLLINGWTAENPLGGDGLFLPWLSWSFIIGGLLAMISGSIYLLVLQQPWIECIAVFQLGLIVAYLGHRIRKRVLGSKATEAASK